MKQHLAIMRANSPIIIPAAGVGAILTTAATVGLSIVFAVGLQDLQWNPSEFQNLRVCAVASATIGIIGIGSMGAVCYILVRNSQDQIPRRGVTKRLPEISSVVSIISSALALGTFVQIHSRLSAPSYLSVPQHLLGASTMQLLIGGFTASSISIIAQLLFLLVAVITCRSSNQQARKSLHTDEEPHNSAEMTDTSRPYTAQESKPFPSIESPESAASENRKRSGSDTIGSIRSSLTQVVRPITSKTRLISQKISYRSSSLDSGIGGRDLGGVPYEDGFDTWDTSAVDPQSRQTVMNSSTSSPVILGGRFLETIPASPPASRSASPGYPLDLEPLEPPMSRQSRHRSRSASPATSYSESARKRAGRERAVSPTNSELHIHPLFRTDSPEPPPAATPGTVVTAAPGAGQVISDRLSISRMRSGSLPASPSPLIHSNSMHDLSDNHAQTEDGGYESGHGRSPTPPEREMTPPIPDWILGAGPRNSMSGYSRRKGAPGLGPVGEVTE